MFRPITTSLTFVLIMVLLAPSFAADRRNLSISRIDSTLITDIKELRVKQEPLSEEACIVNPTENLVWKVEGWVTGNELYKNYLDPSATCENPYPFTVTEINMPLYFARPCMIIVSVDLEDVHYSSAECPWPDSVLAISSDYQLNVAEPGLYNIWIPLDQPVTVHRPFFAGFFIGNSVDTSTGVAVVTNGNTTATCRSYNIWDEQIGFVDLVNNGVWNFPGQLMLYAVGYPGGGEKRTEPEPAITILSPCNGNPLFGNTTIWAYESSGSSIIDHVDFEYMVSGEYRKIGSDFDGTSPVRDGANSADDGDGYSHIWDFSSLGEGYYILRVTAVDTLGRTASDEITVYLEPTPPTPRIIAPRTTTDFCSTFDVLMCCGDEDLRQVTIYHKQAQAEYSAGIKPARKHEYGNNYSAAVAAANAIQLWAERGYTSLIDSDHKDNAFDSLVSDLASRFRTLANQGTTDEALYNGLIEYSADHDSILVICNYSRPDYSTVRIQLEEEENAVLLAMGGSPGVWLALDGFRGWSGDDGTYQVIVADPLTGSMESMPLADKPGGALIHFDGDWHPVERIVTIGAVGWKVERDLIGNDADESDGWAYTVTTDELTPDSRHFIRAEGIDENGIGHYHTVILNYDCSHSFFNGDYDGDGVASIVDLAYLLDFVGKNGPEPVGGSYRADANGDSQLNITDLVYYLNYLYGTAGQPRH